MSGEFDYLIPDGKEHNYQVIIETNRGCPFLCTYCYWGRGGNTTKYRFHSLERIFAEIEWTSRKKIKYVWNADSNFGMHKRDIEIAKKLQISDDTVTKVKKFLIEFDQIKLDNLGKAILPKHDRIIIKQKPTKRSIGNISEDSILFLILKMIELKLNSSN